MPRPSLLVLASILLGCGAALPAQNRDHPGLVSLGDGKWGTAAAAEAAGLVPYRGRWLPRTRLKQLAEWERLDAKSVVWKDAYTTKSKHYRIQTNVPRFIVELEIKPFLDELYETYERVFRSDFGLQGKAANNKLIRIHHRYADYKRETGRTRGNPGYIVNGNELFTFYEDETPADFYGTVFHEGAHQFFKALLPGATLPLWLDEALATYFEGCTYSRATRKITFGGLPPDRLAWARQLLARQAVVSPEEAFMNTGKEAFTAHHYSLSWSFVHFLVNTDGGRYRDGFGRFLREMNGSGAKPVAEVFQAAVRADLAELGKGWRAYVMDMAAVPEPVWVLLDVGEVPAGIDLRSGDQVLRVDGLEVFGAEQFDEHWTRVKDRGTPVELVVLRTKGRRESMDYEYEVVVVQTTAAVHAVVSAGATVQRAHHLAD